MTLYIDSIAVIEATNSRWRATAFARPDAPDSEWALEHGETRDTPEGAYASLSERLEEKYGVCLPDYATVAPVPRERA